MAMDEIRKFKFWCQKVLPLVYDDSLSYYEVLCKIVTKLNEVIKNVDEIPEYINNYIDERLNDEHIKELIIEAIRYLEDAISKANEEDNTNFSTDYNAGDLIWWNNKLYEVLRDVDAGTTIIDSGANPNVEEISFAELFNDFTSNIKLLFTVNDEGTNTNASKDYYDGDFVWINNSWYEVIKNISEGNSFIYSGINQNVSLTHIDVIIHEIKGYIGVLSELDTENKTSLVSALNEVLATVYSITGELDNLITDDKTNLVNAINEIKGDTSKIGDAMVYFPSLEAGTYSGSSAIMVVKGKTILFDCNSRNNENAVLPFYDDLYEKGLFTNIDYVIISHYHGDHTELLGDILSRYPHVGCHAYIAMSPSGYFYDDSQIPTVYSNMAAVISDLTNNGVPYTVVDEEMTIEVNDLCNIELFNSDPTAYTYYLNNTTYYNDYSMVSLVHVGKCNVMFPGDIQRVAQDYIVSNRTLPRLEVYAIHHHNIQHDDNALYLNEIRPNFGVISTSHNRQLESAMWGLCSDYACDHICSTAYSSQIFTLDANAGSACEGIGIARASWRVRTIDFYVDNSYTGNKHDGSSEYPFTNINEANIYIEDKSGIDYNIHVAETETVYPTVHFRNYNCHINVTGGSGYPIVNGCYVHNCRDLEFFHLKFVNRLTSSNSVTCDIQRSHWVNFDTCVFDGCYDVDPVTRRYTTFGIKEAGVYITHCDIMNYTQMVDITRYASVVTNQIDFNNVASCYRIINATTLIRGVDTVTNCDYYMKSGGSGQSIPYDICLPSNTNIATLRALFALNDNNALSNNFILSDKLCSVHGKVLVGAEVSDLNDATMEGYYSYASTASNIPSSVSTTGGALLTLRSTSTYWVQLAFPNAQATMKIAMRKHGPDGWTAWSEIAGT